MHVSCVDTPQPRKTVAGKRGWITAKKFKPSSTQVTSRSAYKHLKVREECNDTPARRGTLHGNAQQSYIKSNWSWPQVSQSTWRQIRIRHASTGRTTSHPVLQSCSSKDHPVASFLPELTVTALRLRLFVLLVLICNLDWTLPHNFKSSCFLEIGAYKRNTPYLLIVNLPQRRYLYKAGQR